MTQNADLLTAYTRLADAETGPSVSLIERARLCLLFDEVGEHAPTLAGAWDAHHLAAHLVIREGSLLTTVKAAVTSGSDTAVDQRVAGSTFSDLVDELRNGPPRLSVFRPARSDAAFNTLEFFIHHEDVRRAAPQWAPRSLPGWAQDQIWARLPLIAKVITRKSAVPVALVRSDDGAKITARKGSNPAVIRGLPSEVALYIHGRTQVAKVETTGPPDAVRRLGEEEFRV